MKLGWLTAWWDQIRRRPPVDPWNDDPEIKRERERQHDDGTTDAAQAFRIRHQLQDHWNENLRESWRHHTRGPG